MDEAVLRIVMEDAEGRSTQGGQDATSQGGTSTPIGSNSPANLERRQTREIIDALGSVKKSIIETSMSSGTASTRTPLGQTLDAIKGYISSGKGSISSIIETIRNPLSALSSFMLGEKGTPGINYAKDTLDHVKSNHKDLMDLLGSGSTVSKETLDGLELLGDLINEQLYAIKSIGLNLDVLVDQALRKVELEQEERPAGADPMLKYFNTGQSVIDAKTEYGAKELEEQLTPEEQAEQASARAEVMEILQQIIATGKDAAGDLLKMADAADPNPPLEHSTLSSQARTAPEQAASQQATELHEMTALHEPAPEQETTLHEPAVVAPHTQTAPPARETQLGIPEPEDVDLQPLEPNYPGEFDLPTLEEEPETTSPTKDKKSGLHPGEQSGARKTGFRSKEEIEELKRVGALPKDFVGNSISRKDYERYLEIMKGLGEEPKFASGGSVGDHPGGPEGTDTIPAWLSEGEFVVNAKAAAENMPELEEMNARKGGSRSRGMARGGRVKHMFIGGLGAAPFKNVALGAMNIGKFAASSGSDPADTVSMFGSAVQNAGQAMFKFLPVLGGITQAGGQVIQAFAGLMQAIDGTVERYGEYSPEIAQAQAVAEIKQTLGDMQRAQKVGNELAKYVHIRAELQQNIEDAKIELLKQIAPMVTDILKVFNDIKPMAESARDTGLDLFSVIKYIRETLTDVANSARKIAFLKAKEDDEKDNEKIKDPTEELLKNKNWQEGGSYVPEV